MKKVYLFGTGLDAEVLLSKIKKLNYDNYTEIIGCINNDATSWGKNFCGIKIISPGEIEAGFDYIIISSRDYYDEIHNQCINELEVPADKLINIDKYLRLANIHYQFSYNLLNNRKERKNELTNNSRIAVYTAITGDYDTLKNPEVISKDVDYICYTDNPNLKSDVWDVRLMDNDITNSAYKIRLYKILPHRFLSEYDISIWIDGSYLIKSDLIQYVKEYDRGSGCLFFPHPDRICIYDEVAALIDYRKEKKSNLIRQAATYLEEGYPENNGLVAGGCIVRHHNDTSVIKTMDIWWDEIHKYGDRDQIALAYSLWKTNLQYDLCDMDINNNKWTCWKRHTSGANVKC